MSNETGKDWRWEILSELEGFSDSVYTIDESALKILLCDEGQMNVVWDSIRHLFPTSRLRSGDVLTALELGKLVGGYHSLWSVLLANCAYHERFAMAAADVTAVRVLIDAVLAENMPSAMQGPATGIFHLLEALMAPEMIGAVRANRKRFETVLGSVFEFVRAQDSNEFQGFMAGYGQAFACCPVDVEGLPINADKTASLIAVFRPFLMMLGCSATDLQDCLDCYLPENVAPNPDSLSKYLQRRKAPLRGKGRPAKKAKKATASTRKK